MTRKFPFPLILAFVCLIAVSFVEPAAAAGKKKAAVKVSARDKKGRSSKASQKASSRRETAKSKTKARGSRDRRGRTERASVRGRNARDRRSARSDRGRRDRREVATKDLRKMSRRERAREISRRRREAAERARRAAIARAIYLAKIRAQDQAYRDETAANILKDDTTGEDLEIRRVAIQALGERAGTVVVMDPKTGRVFTVVNQDWALRKGFKPCSTIKLVTGLAGLNEKVIDPVQTVNIGTASFSLDLTDSLALSNNGYFQRVGGQVGFEKMMEYSRKLGLGQPTGINHPYESPGRLPVFKEGWSVNRMSSHGDDIEVTPIQLATMTSAIVNGGKLLIPHLPRTPQENVKFDREVKGEVNVPEDHLRRLVPGMIGAVNFGTANRAYDPLQTIGGKTGSCIGQGSWLGLFTSYAPVHDPKLAVVVVTRGSGARGKYAASVAGDIYRNLHQRFGIRPGGATLLANDLAPRPKIDPRKAEEVSDEGKDEEEAEADAFVVSESATSANNTQVTTTSVPTIPPAVKAPATTEPQTNGMERPRRVTPEN
jgi:penicillin-binding protein 2